MFFSESDILCQSCGQLYISKNSENSSASFTKHCVCSDSVENIKITFHENKLADIHQRIEIIMPVEVEKDKSLDYFKEDQDPIKSPSKQESITESKKRTSSLLRRLKSSKTSENKFGAVDETVEETVVEPPPSSSPAPDEEIENINTENEEKTNSIESLPHEAFSETQEPISTMNSGTQNEPPIDSDVREDVSTITDKKPSIDSADVKEDVSTTTEKKPSIDNPDVKEDVSTTNEKKPSIENPDVKENVSTTTEKSPSIDNAHVKEDVSTTTEKQLSMDNPDVKENVSTTTEKKPSTDNPDVKEAAEKKLSSVSQQLEQNENNQLVPYVSKDNYSQIDSIDDLNEGNKSVSKQDAISKKSHTSDKGTDSQLVSVIQQTDKESSNKSILTNKDARRNSSCPKTDMKSEGQQTLCKCGRKDQFPCEYCLDEYKRCKEKQKTERGCGCDKTFEDKADDCLSKWCILPTLGGKPNKHKKCDPPKKPSKDEKCEDSLKVSKYEKCEDSLKLEIPDKDNTDEICPCCNGCMTSEQSEHFKKWLEQYTRPQKIKCDGENKAESRNNCKSKHLIIEKDESKSKYPSTVDERNKPPPDCKPQKIKPEKKKKKKKKERRNSCEDVVCPHCMGSITLEEVIENLSETAIYEEAIKENGDLDDNKICICEMNHGNLVMSSLSRGLKDQIINFDLNSTPTNEELNESETIYAITKIKFDEINEMRIVDVKPLESDGVFMLQKQSFIKNPSCK